jgi:hypothetical protein
MKHKRRSSTGFILLTLAALTGLIPLPAAAQTFTTRILAHVPRNVTSVSLNDNGWATWTTGLGNDSQTYLWGGSGVVTLGFAGRNNRDGRINNNDWVVWVANKISNPNHTEIYLWRGQGTPVSLSAAIDTSAEPDINHLNDIAWWGGTALSNISDVYYLAHDAVEFVNLTAPDSGNAAVPKLDNTGLFSWERTIGDDETGDVNLAFALISDPLDLGQASISNDFNVTNGDISDSGKLVWRQYDDAAFKYNVWQYDRTTSTRTNLTQNLTGNSHDPVVREDGTVAWHTDTFSPSMATLYWYKNNVREIIPITVSYNLNRPLALNNRGQVLFASGNGTGTGFDIVLATPSDAAPSVSGTITLEDIVGTAAAQRITLTFRPSDNAPEFTRRVMLAPNGTFTVYDVPATNYVVHIKGKKWLATNVNVNTMSGSVTGVTATLKAGDSNDNNMIEVLDLDRLIQAFDADPNAPNWNEDADSNCDGSVDVLDLDILIRNFDLEGAP